MIYDRIMSGHRSNIVRYPNVVTMVTALFPMYVRMFDPFELIGGDMTGICPKYWAVIQQGVRQYENRG